MPAARSCSNQRQLPDSYGYLIHPLLKSERREQETRRSSTPGHSRTILSIPEGSSNVPSLLSHKKAWTSLQNWREFSFSCTRFNASKPSTCHISDNYGYCWGLFSAFRRRCVTGSRGYHSKIGVNFPVAPASAVELGSKDVITVDFRSADFVNAVAKKDRLGTDRSPARNYLTKSLVLGLSTPTLQKCCGPRRHF